MCQQQQAERGAVCVGPRSLSPLHDCCSNLSGVRPSCMRCKNDQKSTHRQQHNCNAIHPGHPSRICISCTVGHHSLSGWAPRTSSARHVKDGAETASSHDMHHRVDVPYGASRSRTTTLYDVKHHIMLKQSECVAVCHRLQLPNSQE